MRLSCNYIFAMSMALLLVLWTPAELLGEGESNMDKIKPNYIELSREKENNIIEKLNIISVGDGVDKVLEAMGRPDYDQKLASKEGVFKARVLRYYIRRISKDIVNEKADRYISFYFDENNKVVEVKRHL